VRAFRHTGRFLEAIAPRPRLHATGSLALLYGAYVLFALSLGLPVLRFWSFRGDARVTTYGVEWLIFGLAGNMGFIAGLLGGRSLSPVVVSWGLGSSLLGIVQGVAVLAVFASFESVPLAGFWAWFASLLALAVWFARFREKPAGPKGPRVRWRPGRCEANSLADPSLARIRNQDHPERLDSTPGR
jgi:hypothetical protein